MSKLLFQDGVDETRARAAASVLSAEQAKETFAVIEIAEIDEMRPITGLCDGEARGYAQIFRGD